MITVENLTKHFPSIKAVDSISFAINRGEVVGLLGKNGAGKSTTLKILAGMMNPTSGTARIDGQEISIENTELKARIGFVPESVNLYECLSAREYLLFVGRMHGLDDQAIENKIQELLSFFEISDRADERLTSYSKGMKRKVLFSSALLTDLDILLLDEPLDGLDVNTQIKLKALIQSHAKSGKIVIYSSHILDVVEKVCSRLIILDHGRMVEDDTIESLHTRYGRESLEEIFVRLTESGPVFNIQEDRNK